MAEHEQGGNDGDREPDEEGASPRDEPADGERRQVRIRLDEEQRQGTYANLLVVTHGPHDFTLDFCVQHPPDREGRSRADVVSRVRIPPTLVGKAIRALNTNLTSYEDRYGMVHDVG